jgi:hypothetical protein
MNFRNKLIFYGEELLAPRPTPKLEDHPLSAVRDRLFSISGGRLLHPQTEDEPCRGDKGPPNMASKICYNANFRIFSIYFLRKW